MLFFDTIAEYDEEIAAVRETMRREGKIGEDHSNNSGGSSRATKEIDYDKLKQYFVDLRRGRADLMGYGGPSRCGFGW